MTKTEKSFAPRTAKDHLAREALVAAVFDSILAFLFAAYLLSTRQAAR